MSVFTVVELSEPKAQVWVPRGWQILLFVTYDLQDGWTNLGQTFRDYRGYPGERPRKRIFWKSWKIKKFKFLESPVGFVKDCEEVGKIATDSVL